VTLNHGLEKIKKFDHNMRDGVLALPAYVVKKLKGWER